MQPIYLGEATAALRRIFLYLVDVTDGFTPETAEAGGQPNYSLNGVYVGNTAGILVVVDAANQPGCYYVTLSAAEIAAPGKLLVRYKSAATRECVATAHVSTPLSTYFGTVVADAGNLDFLFRTDLGAIPDIRDSQLVMLTGVTAKQTSSVNFYNAATGFITIFIPLAAVPAAGDTFVILPAAFNSRTAMATDMTGLVTTVGVAGAGLAAITGTMALDATVAKAAQFVAETAAVNDAAATTSSFITTLASVIDNFYVGAEMSFTTGPLTTAPPVGIASYVGAERRVTLMRPLPVAPANGNAFVVERDIAATLSVSQNIGV